MNKKILIFLVIVLSAISIMAVSIWGTLAESNSLPSISSIEISKYDVLNEFGDKIIFVKDIITEENYMFRINYTVSPSEADKDRIKAKVDVSEGIEVISTIADMYVTVIFDTDKIGQAVTVTIWDSKTMKEDSVTLLFANENEVDIDDPDIFE